MKDIDEIRRDNLRLLDAEHGGPTGAARVLEMSPAQFTNLRDGAKDSKTGKRRGMRKDTARRIEAAFGKPAGWLDVDHSRPIVAGGGGIDSSFAATSEKAPLIVDMQAGNTSRRAPVVAWARLGDDLRKPNEDWPAEAMRAINSTKPMSGLVKWVEVQDDLLTPRVLKGDWVAVDPDGAPRMDSLVLAKAADGSYMLRFYRPLAGGAFEVIDGAGRTMDSLRHGIQFEAAFVTLQRDNI